MVCPVLTEKYLPCSRVLPKCPPARRLMYAKVTLPTSKGFLREYTSLMFSQTERTDTTILACDTHTIDCFINIDKRRVAIVEVSGLSLRFVRAILHFNRLECSCAGTMWALHVGHVHAFNALHCFCCWDRLQIDGSYFTCPENALMPLQPTNPSLLTTDLCFKLSIIHEYWQAHFMLKPQACGQRLPPRLTAKGKKNLRAALEFRQPASGLRPDANLPELSFSRGCPEVLPLALKFRA